MILAQDDVSVALRVKVAGVLSAKEFGRFGLVAQPSPPFNLFLNLEGLQGRLELEGRANLLLASLADVEAAHTAAGDPTARLAEALRSAWTLSDAELELRRLELPGDLPREVELRTSRVFLDDPVAQALESARDLELTGVLTYFTNALRAGERSTPYSMVSALGPLGSETSGPWEELAPARADDIVVNRWLADDLQVGAGDSIVLEYFVADPSQRLVERESTFRVARVVPIEGRASDRELMPNFPGLADEENCRDWEPGVPVELDRIRDKDETYWDDYRGTPKGFLQLAAGREIWGSRFGSLTAIRADAAQEARIRSILARELDPAALGLFFRDVRSAAAQASDSPTDFGGLFVGLSFFLIVASLLLAAQLFLFGVGERASEIGLLAAIGFRARDVRRLFFGEAAALTLLGGLLGIGLGLLYTRAVLWGLASLWSDAVANAPIAFHAEPSTVATGFAIALVACFAAVACALWRKLRQPSFRLLMSEHGLETDEAAPDASARARGISWAVIALALVAVLAILLLVDATTGVAAAGAFFGAGSLVLVAGLLASRLWLRRAVSAGGSQEQAASSIVGLGLRNATRRPGRSLATIAMMAIGTFLVVSVGANRQGPVQDTDARQSGTGGFALYGQTSLAVVQDLNGERGREAFGLDSEDLERVAFVGLRVRDGDDASCLNLSRPRAPRLLGVEVADLAERKAFPFAGLAEPSDDPWTLLRETPADGTIPAIGDTTSLTWQLHKKIGDTLDYTDERGRNFQVRIVGTIADTVLQGDLLIDARRFEELFPSEGGYRLFLVDAPAERVGALSELLSRALEDVGLSLERTGERLDAFHAVQNTYLSIFQLLGALGLLLGSVGLGMVVLRNTQERRAELALARALGFRAGDIRRWIFAEYAALLATGLAIGLAAALIAILPALRTPGSDLPLTNVLSLLALVAANGLLWIYLATLTGSRRAPLAALREE